ncbi:MAG: hypothetical protein U0797_23200 [Gemmataceae bacterium]
MPALTATLNDGTLDGQRNGRQRHDQHRPGLDDGRHDHRAGRGDCRGRQPVHRGDQHQVEPDQRRRRRDDRPGGLALEGNIVANLGKLGEHAELLNGEVGGTLAVNGAAAAGGRGHGGYGLAEARAASTDMGDDHPRRQPDRRADALGQGGGIGRGRGRRDRQRGPGRVLAPGRQHRHDGERDRGNRRQLGLPGSGLDDSLIAADVGGSLLAATGAGADKVGGDRGRHRSARPRHRCAGDDGVTLGGAVGGWPPSSPGPERTP